MNTDLLMYDVANGSPNDLSRLEYVYRLSSKGYRYSEELAIQSDIRLEQLRPTIEPFILSEGTGGGYQRLLLELPEAFIFISIWNHCWWNMHVSGPAPEGVHQLIQLLTALLPKAQHLVDERINMLFSSLRRDGAVIQRSRRIAVPRWKAIEPNYTSRTQKMLEQLMTYDQTGLSAGKLILLHGSPGTGKTFAIRALLREWADWCDGQYVVDPEHFFGEAEYMLGVLISDDDYLPTIEITSTSGGLEMAEKKDRWRLVIIEDADEFLTVDAKQRQGQALSRLLNITDGLVGQALKHLILMTTNEKLDNIHPAIARQGRCLAEIHFGSLTVSETKDWLRHYEIEPAAKQEAMTLAELYGRVSREKLQSRPDHRMGFQIGVN